MKSTTRKTSSVETTAQDNPGSKPELNAVSVKIARSVEELMQAFAVRSAVFLGEQHCPYAEEFDGNDFSATQFLGLVGAEPASTCRMRYFADFAKFERLAVRQEFRKSGVAAEMIEYALELCRQKGYRKIYGHSQARLVPFWQKFGFEPLNDKIFIFSDHKYVEIECLMDPHPDPVVVGKNPMVIIRPEGAWDEPGVLERSSDRAATNPTGDEPADDIWEAELRNQIKRPFEHVEQHIPDSVIPFDDSYPWYVLIEASVGASHEVLENALSESVEQELVLDAVIAKSSAEADKLWRLRHSISEAEKQAGVRLKHDISVSIGHMEEFLERSESLLAEECPEAQLVAFGHVGDGNLHYNVHLPGGATDEDLSEQEERISALIYDLVDELGGSFSAEHGVGASKREYLARYKNETDLDLMRSLKNALDPKNILNPGKVI